MEEEIQDLVQRLVNDDEEAAFRLVEDYYTRLQAVARARLLALPNQIADDEGAVVSALRSFFSGLKKEHYPQLSSEDDLWRILATITARKALQQVRRHRGLKRDQDRVCQADVSQLLDRQPAVAEVTAFIDECDVRISQLPNETLRSIAMFRLQGMETAEIAKQLGVHQRTIQRKLSVIQSHWQLASS